MKNKVIQNIVNEIRPRRREKLEEEMSLEEKTVKKRISEAIECLQEMGAVHCKKDDGYGIIVMVGNSVEKNKKSRGSQKEHNPPHAHVWSSDMKFKSRFLIVSENPPQSDCELQKVDDSDMDFGKYGEKIVEWANQRPKRAASEGDETNWDAMRSSWRDIQEIINMGLKKPQYI
jgi:hypothetical protein